MVGARSHRTNNINILRLLAASQVMVIHGMEHLPDTHYEAVLGVLRYLPGVPLFFFLSGYLITGSWMRNPDIGGFVRRRILRIYPGLIVTALLSTAAMMILHHDAIMSNLVTFIMWFVAQTTFLQSWNPSFIRSYGTGVANGSLWTIPIELAFYMAAPALLLIGQRTGKRLLVVTIAIALSLFLYIILNCLYNAFDTDQSMISKIFTLSPLSAITWFWMFGIGMLACIFKDSVIPLLVKNFWVLLVLYVVLAVLSSVLPATIWLRSYGNNLGLTSFLVTGGLALSFAYSFPGLSDKILGESDFSYGIYIYHMPIVNIFVAMGISGGRALVATVLITLLLASVSWFLVERPSLNRRVAPAVYGGVQSG